MNIAICDDEQKICESYSEKVMTITKSMGITADITQFNTPIKLLLSISTVYYDIILLDIDMPDMDGMQAAYEMEKLSYDALLIFITNQDAFVYQSFRYHPFGFIRKSHVDEELEQVLIHAVKKLKAKQKHFCFRQDSELISLLISDILYFEAAGNYLSIYTNRQEDAVPYICRNTISKVEDELSCHGFIRIHKGFLVNQEAVYRIGNDDVVLINQISLPISRKNKNEIKQKLMRYLMK